MVRKGSVKRGSIKKRSVKRGMAKRGSVRRNKIGAAIFCSDLKNGKHKCLGYNPHPHTYVNGICSACHAKHNDHTDLDGFGVCKVCGYDTRAKSMKNYETDADADVYPARKDRTGYTSTYINENTNPDSDPDSDSD